MAHQTIQVEHQGPVAHITLNRPESRNAMSLLMVAELRLALEEAQRHGSRVVVLRGAGGHFCSGADLQDMAAARMRAASGGDTEDPIAAVSADFGKLCVAYSHTPLAVVAVLEGTVMGGGFGLACVADVAIASTTAVFRLPETSLGVVPAQIAPFLVERLGYSQAKRLAVTGGKVDAAQALHLGLVHEVCAPSDLSAVLQQTLTSILACAPQALAATKALMARARLHEPQSLVAEAAAVFAHSAKGPEGVEGINAFIQKRKPQWAVS